MDDDTTGSSNKKAAIIGGVVGCIMGLGIFTGVMALRNKDKLDKCFECYFSYSSVGLPEPLPAPVPPAISLEYYHRSTSAPAAMALPELDTGIGPRANHPASFHRQASAPHLESDSNVSNDRPE